METISIWNVETKLVQWCKKTKAKKLYQKFLIRHKSFWTCLPTMVASLYLLWNKLRPLLKSQSQHSALLVRNRILIVNILVRPQQTRWWRLAIAIMTKRHRIIREYKQSLLHFWYTYVHITIATRFNNESIIAYKLSLLCRMSACRFCCQTAAFCVVSATCRDTSLVMSQTQENVVWAGCPKQHEFEDMSGDSRHVGNFVIVVWAQTQKLYDS